MKTTTLLLLLLSGLSISLAGQEGWTAENIMKYGNISQTSISPDGSHVAYVVRKAVMEGNKSEYNSQIWVASADGSRDYQYTRGEKSSTSPRFSPDGERIAFLSNRTEDKNQIFIMRLHGGEAEQITSAKSGVGSFRWSPEGNRIAFTMTDPKTDEEEKREKDKSDVILVDQEFKYSHIYVVFLDRKDSAGYAVKQITTGDMQVTDFDWSPDGSTIVFSHAPDPSLNTLFYETDISSVPADSGSVVSLVKRPGIDSNPRYSPDGKWIVFESSGGKIEPVGLTDIYRIPASGGDPVSLSTSPDRSAGIVDWDQSGEFIYVTEPYKTSVSLFALPVLEQNKDSNLSPITSLDGTSNSFSISRTGAKIAYVYEEPETAAELYVSDLAGQNAKKLSSINAEFPSGEPGETELIKWKSKDGLEIEGLLTYPVGYKKDTPYPVILQIHGGPAGVFTKSYTGQPSIYMIQLFAQEGYLVLRPNPRGSTGYGKDFRYANVKDWGYGDYQDLMTGLDHLIELGIADKERQYVMGWSYGGYMTSWIVTQTDRFRAASMGAGLPNLISMVTTTDINDYLVAHLGGKEYWEDYQEYEKHSAIYHIANVSTPTQILHGAQDERVPTSQGTEFYTSLKRLGVDTEMILYPRTPHGPREPKLLMDVSPRILKWFEKY